MVAPAWRSWGRTVLRARRMTPGEAAAAGGWLVLAPHPDDETLGAGGLIAGLSRAGGDVIVAFLTDGSGSHVGAPGWSAQRIAGVRTQEARAALQALGYQGKPVWLGWRDAMPVARGSSAYEADVRGLVSLCRRRRVRHVVTSWEADPHCDHEAAAHLAAEVARRLRVTPSFYSVWGWTIPDLDKRLAAMRATALPAMQGRARARRALACHRTQLGGRITGAVERFVLPRSMRRLVDATHTLLLEHRHAS